MSIAIKSSPRSSRTETSSVLAAAVDVAAAAAAIAASDEPLVGGLVNGK